MPRIVYLAFPDGRPAGGQKMILRHVETLRDLGFDAVHWRTPDNPEPAWLDHRAPMEVGTAFRPDDILVLPEDGPNALQVAATLPQRVLVFCQAQLALAAVGLPALEAFPPERFPTFIVPGRVCAAVVGRIFPQATIEVIPAFVDERLFRWRGAKRRAVAYIPRKRPLEAQAIRHLFQRRRPADAAIPWTALENAREVEVAETFARSALFLSLSRLEAVGMTPLEAMASGCAVAGFTGGGGRDFATPDNGFWVEAEDDWEAAADALAQAADLTATGGAALARRLEAGHETAARWSYANFRTALEDVWMRLAPEARIKDGPLDQEAP